MMWWLGALFFSFIIGLFVGVFVLIFVMPALAVNWCWHEKHYHLMGLILFLWPITLLWMFGVI
jgi:hypothetical protein